MSNTNFDEELDLNNIISSINKKIQSYIFNFLNLLLNNKLKIVILIFLGIGIGFFLNQLFSKRVSQLIVLSNNNSVEYLYSKIQNLQSNFSDPKAKKFIKNINHVEITPIVDVYKFTGTKESNLETLKMYAEDGDIMKMTEDKNFIKNYDSHIISISNGNNLINEKMINEIINYLNNDLFYKELLKISKENYLNKIKQNELLIQQIDILIAKYNTQDNKGGQLLYNNENLQLNDLLKTKVDLFNENNNIRIKLVETKNTINLLSYDLNTIVKPKVNFIFLLPILFLFFYFMFIYISLFYKNFKEQQSHKINI
ncbi:hypothetical protein ACTS9V_06025 [Empedobacter falsenii]|uniref:hypothetical protein n=1 Tax=Empedobacter sp. GD03797 TaxID=2975382 RepID=UPI00244C1B26|nr:hypothetical protein [Empedobacter sp. GD03797]MDH1882753.1 hypothetical protein [Empedobacter sp. GD03797]